MSLYYTSAVSTQCTIVPINDSAPRIGSQGVPSPLADSYIADYSLPFGHLSRSADSFFCLNEAIHPFLFAVHVHFGVTNMYSYTGDVSKQVSK